MSYLILIEDEPAAVFSGGSYIADSTLRYAPDMSKGTPDILVKDRPVWVACESGYRANIAASFLRRDGYQPVVLMDAGVTDVLAELSNS